MKKKKNIATYIDIWYKNYCPALIWRHQICPCNCLQFQESVIPCPCHDKAGTKYFNTHQYLWDHKICIQNLIDTFALIQSLLLPVVKKTHKKMYTHFSASAPSASCEAQRKLYPLIVSDCYKLFPWNLLLDFWGLGPFLAAFCASEKSVKMCFMRMDEALYPSQDIY